MKGRARLRRLKLEAMQFIREQRRACADCGRTTDLTFHHLDRAEKSFTIGNASHERYLVGLKKLSREIDKAVVVCGSCHRHREKMLKRGGESSNGRTDAFEASN